MNCQTTSSLGNDVVEPDTEEYDARHFYRKAALLGFDSVCIGFDERVEDDRESLRCADKEVSKQ